MEKKFNLLKKLNIFKHIKNIFVSIKSKVKQHIRLKLILTFVLCLIASIIVLDIVSEMSRSRYATIEYESGIRDIDSKARYIMEYLTESSDFINDHESFKDFIHNRANAGSLKIRITDIDGNVLYKSDNATETKIDIYSVIKNAMDNRYNEKYGGYGYGYSDNIQEFYSIYPVSFETTKAYLIVSGVPEGTVFYHYRENGFLPTISAIATFILLFYILTKRKMNYIEELVSGILEISTGNLDFRVKVKSQDELGSLANNINFMAMELNERIENERKAEKMKSELITNVSHDLRTPLTSIMGYLRLVKDKNFNNTSELENYIDIAYQKSEKLKVLIEDLFEYTKLSNSGVKIDLKTISINELIEQLIEELVPIAAENNISFVKKITDKKIYVDIDPDKTVRVFENLLMNAIRYSYKPGIVKISLSSSQDTVTIGIENTGDNIPLEYLDKLFDRFYRVEKSRSSNSGGSGLGLAIAKNLVEIQGGKIWAECTDNIISFKVRFKRNN